MVFIPPGLGPQWGLFEPSGRAVPESIPYSGAGPAVHNVQCSLECNDLLGHPILSENFNYVFIGNVEDHYGHFLIGPFARLWALPNYDRKKLRIVFSSSRTSQELFELEFFREMMSALGLSYKNLLRITSKVAISSISVAACPFEELSMVHSIFAEMMNRVGRQIIGPFTQNFKHKIIYMSKERLKEGNIRVTNEAALTKILSKNGIDIAFPEEMSFVNQIQLWANNPIVIGFSGSALHTSVFFPRRTAITIAHGPEMWANQVLIDTVNENRAKYLYDDTGLIPVGAGEGFAMCYEIKQPQEMAESLIDRLREV